MDSNHCREICQENSQEAAVEGAEKEQNKTHCCMDTRQVQTGIAHKFDLRQSGVSGSLLAPMIGASSFLEWIGFMRSEKSQEKFGVDTAQHTS